MNHGTGVMRRPRLAGQRPAPFARGPVIAVGAFVTVLLVVVAGRSGYHRDEL